MKRENKRLQKDCNDLQEDSKEAELMYEEQIELLESTNKSLRDEFAEYEKKSVTNAIKNITIRYQIIYREIAYIINSKI